MKKDVDWEHLDSAIDWLARNLRTAMACALTDGVGKALSDELIKANAAANKAAEHIARAHGEAIKAGWRVAMPGEEGAKDEK